MKNRAGDINQTNGFDIRTVMAMATEMADAQDSMNRLRIQFAALAASMGVALVILAEKQ